MASAQPAGAQPVQRRAAHEDRQHHHRQRPRHHRDQPSTARTAPSAAPPAAGARSSQALERLGDGAPLASCSRRQQESAKAARSVVHRACRAPGRRMRQLGLVQRRPRRAGAHQVRLAAGGRARPAGRAACRRPPARCLRSTPKRSPMSLRTGPAAACGSRSRLRACAGRRTPRRCGRPCSASSWCILACIALSVAMSNRPRPMPDWLVATTVCQPAWLAARSPPARRAAAPTPRAT